MSNLHNNIAPEIVNDEFGNAIKNIVAKPGINLILEIGTGSGDGSTACFVDALFQKTNKQKCCHSIEISKTRIKSAQNKYRQLDWMYFHNGCSIHPDEYATEFDLTEFYNTKKTALNQYPLSTVLQWRADEIEYIEQNKVETRVIDAIKLNHSIDTFDFVLIDGSEFTGCAELKYVYGAKFIALDDIDAFKNNQNYFELIDSPDYVLHCENWNLRNGYAIFKLK